jgi:hypothetical protein
MLLSVLVRGDLSWNRYSISELKGGTADNKSPCCQYFVCNRAPSQPSLPAIYPCEIRDKRINKSVIVESWV